MAPTEAAKTKLVQLGLKRLSVINRIKETYEAALTASKDKTYQSVFLARAELLDKIYEEFYTIQTQIMGLLTDDESFSTHDALRIEFDKNFYAIKAHKMDILSSLSKGHILASTSSEEKKVEAKLPEVKLPTFDGNYKLWPSFIDLYNTVIHNHASLSPSQKFQYLMTSLSGEAYNLLKGIPMTEANYKLAYDTLTKRYQNKRFLATNYFYEIYNATSLHNKGSCRDIRGLVDIFSENVTALKILGFPVDHWDFLLFNILMLKLDNQTKTAFEMHLSNVDIPTYKQLITFLDNHCRALESVQFTAQNKVKTDSADKKYHKHQHSSAFLTETTPDNNKIKCQICSSSHTLNRCSLFIAKPPQQRLNFVKQHNICVNCLRSPHPLRLCKSTATCKFCRFPHHTLLHLNKSNVSQQTPYLNTEPQQHNNSTSSSSDSSHDAPQVSAMTSTTVNKQSTVLLSTALVDILDGFGSYQKVRVLFDTGSMANFISERCVQRLNLRKHPFSIPIEGLADMSTPCNNGLTNCIIKPCNQDKPILQFNAIILKRVCSDQPKIPFNISDWSHIKDLPLADPSFNQPGSIDILLGAELIPFIFGPGKIFGKTGQSTAIETIFGWTFLGTIDFSTPTHCISFHASMEPQLDLLVEKFWSLEQVSSNLPKSAKENQCELLFQNSTYRLPSGRFVVSLPFKHEKPDLGNSYTPALRRFSLLEKRLARIPELKSSYNEFMRDYIDSGHMSIISKPERNSSSAYYIPHHCIIKPESVSTKLRVVFDASAKTTKGVSLNDTLLTGPKLQQDIGGMLLKFRFFPLVFVCDIKQMYRQILVNPLDRDYQRILWRFSVDEPLEEYRLNTVTYGVSSSPYLALRTLKELAFQERSRYPNAAQILDESLYVDDCMVGSDSVDSALSLQKELIQLLKLGGFELRKWASNHPQLLESIPSSDVQMTLSFDKEEPQFVKILGLQWNPLDDYFSYACTLTDKPCTKRSILSQIARFFDPLGLASPVILKSKHILQQLWALQNLDWDDIPPFSLCSQWNKIKDELPNLSKLNIPRRCFTDNILRCELHAFCDASQIGYASAVYFRSELNSGSYQTYLVCSKSRVAPLKTISLPRLELCAAVLLADLVQFVTNTYTKLIVFDAIYAWSDSQVVLSWLASSPHKWKTFVANRVAHIQNILPPTSWHYVPSEFNPADCASRGLSPIQLLSHKLWWSGPAWLAENQKLWPNQPNLCYDENTIELEKTTAFHVSVEANSVNLLLNKFSSLIKIQRIIAYLLRFPLILKNKNSLHAPLSPTEIHNALMVIVKRVQSESFSTILNLLEKNKLLPKPYRKLAVFTDSGGVLRVGGRLKNSLFSYDVKHPILLPKSHRFTELLIEHVHKINLHPGLKTLHYLLLQQFWILSPHRAIERCLSRCLKCFRSKPKSCNPFMGDLPIFRVSQLKVFSNVMVDYAGPFSITMGTFRGAKTSKGYICVFVCCATKAIHLELVSSLSSDAFLAAFRRFISRRGRCSDVYSDQGTNFVGAKNYITELTKTTLEKLSINWHLSSPASPHFNGLVEAGVKSVKTHLFRVIGEQILNFEEFYTLLTQIEALLNSRPLCAISSDPNDLCPLTPGHFLTLEPLTGCLPEPNLTTCKLNRLTRWQLLQRMHSDFWKRWQNEYLHTLQQRSKWLDKTPNIDLNTLVLIKNEQRPPLQWSLGRVVELHPGTDGIVRVVTLKTPQGLLRRPVVKVCPLPNN